jgi:hypothetical protein
MIGTVEENKKDGLKPQLVTMVESYIQVYEAC